MRIMRQQAVASPCALSGGHGGHLGHFGNGKHEDHALAFETVEKAVRGELDIDVSGLM